MYKLIYPTKLLTLVYAVREALMNKAMRQVHSIFPFYIRVRVRDFFTDTYSLQSGLTWKMFYLKSNVAIIAKNEIILI